MALPDAPLDPSSAQEGTLIRHGLPYLQQVFASAHWRIFAVQAPTPLVSGPGRLTSLGHDSFALAAASPGRFVVRVHFTRFWSVAGGAGCVSAGAGRMDGGGRARAGHGGGGRALLARAPVRVGRLVHALSQRGASPYRAV